MKLVTFGVSGSGQKRGVLKIHIFIKIMIHLLGICLPNTETAVANKRPQSAITVSVKGMPINAKHMQNALPPIVTGTMLP